MKRFRVLVYISMGIFIATGIVMMMMNIGYASSFDLGDTWTLFLLLKHIFVVFLIIVGIYMLQGVFPKLEKLAAKGPSPELGKAEKRQKVVGAISLILCVIILVFTAVNGAVSALV